MLSWIRLRQKHIPSAKRAATSKSKILLLFGLFLLFISPFSIVLLCGLLCGVRRSFIIGKRLEAKLDTDLVRLLQADTFVHVVCALCNLLREVIGALDEWALNEAMRPVGGW